MTPGPAGTDLLQFAQACLKSGRLADAERAALTALETGPKDDAVRLLLATVKMRTEDFEGAVKWAMRTLRLAPESHGSLEFQSEFAWRTGKPEEAFRLAERLITLFPEDAFAWNNLGFFNSTFKRHDRAAICYANAASREPGYAPFHSNLGNAFAVLDRTREAIIAFGRSVELDPTSFDALSSLATQHMYLSEMREAAACCRKAFALEPETPRGLVEGAKARIYASAGLEEAEELLRKAIERDPQGSDLYAHLGFVLQKIGKFDQATGCLLKAIELNPRSAGAYADLLSGRRVKPEDLPLVERLAALGKDPGLTPYDRRLIGFTLGKSYNELGRYGEAMAACDEAHRIDREVFGKHFDRDAYQDVTDLLIRLFDEDPSRWQDAPASPSEMPIFIVGMMRSGTTLVEQILSSHSQVAAGGEIGFWVLNFFDAVDRDTARLRPDRCQALTAEYLELLRGLSLGGPKAADKPRVTDKLPENFRSLGLLRALFPKAKMIHCRRDPVDTCLSIYMQPFTAPPAYVHDKADLVFAYREYERLTEHWRRIFPPGAVYEVNYHELVAEPERITRELLSYCGLDWEEACLQPEQNTRAVFTASHWQVRQPVYSTSVGRWKRYEPWLGELRELHESIPSPPLAADS